MNRMGVSGENVEVEFSFIVPEVGAIFDIIKLILKCTRNMKFSEKM